MEDLIWIGNTLYPRWIVFLGIGLIVIAIAAVTSSVSRPNSESGK
ncbi:hypothetical protein ACRQ5Q_24440 [Bradyrhizobium sp. PMVTL-01]